MRPFISNCAINYSLGIILSILALIVSCSSPCDSVFALMQKQEIEKQAHLQYDAKLFLTLFADTVLQVKDGKVSAFTKPQLEKRFSDYFEAVEFVKWDDTAEPLITLSADGSMATVLVQKDVELRLRQDTSQTVYGTHFVWQEVWKRKNSDWFLHSLVSTDYEYEPSM